MTGPCENDLVQAVLSGLLEGKSKILTRMERDPDHYWRLQGEFRQMNGDHLEETCSLLIMLTLQTHTGESIDGSRVNQLLEVAKKCGIKASNLLDSAMTERKLMLKREENRRMVHSVHSAKIGMLISSFLSRDRSDFQNKCANIINQMSYFGETVNETRE